MPRFAKLKPLEPDEEWKKQTIHFNRKEWNEVLEVAKDLGYDDLSSVVKECIRLGKIYLRFKREKVKEIKERIKTFNLQPFDLFNQK